ncbi:hypothetical protein [Tritonibacter mobilis]|uniref:hypothetical protein n=1 Tax=Tritonibacter mobilis TaxID=379347 RepID=UPI0039A44A86
MSSHALPLGMYAWPKNGLQEKKRDMLYNRDFLLLHYPKTADKSVAVYFCQNFEKPIYGRVSQGQVAEIGMGPDEGVELEVAGSHDNYAAATKVLKEKDIDITALRALLLPVRNPYDLVVSNYFFLRASYEKSPSVRNRPNFQLAARSTFPEFCAQSNMADFANFMPPAADSATLPVELIHFENLAGSQSAILKKYGMQESYPLPHLNSSKRPRNIASMYDEASKLHVDQKMDSMFRIGGYEKIL